MPSPSHLDAPLADCQACWNKIDALITRGETQGNGCDDLAQRNGLVIASNILMQRIVERQGPGNLRNHVTPFTNKGGHS